MNGSRKTFWVAGQVLKWMGFLLVIAVFAVSIYYIVDNFLMPAVQGGPAETGNNASAPVTEGPTTTTTVPSRTDLAINGTDRYDTAITISRLGFPGGSPTLVLVAGQDYAGAVCAAPLAGVYGAPLLLLPPEGISTELSAEIDRLNSGTVFLVGVPSSSALRRQLRNVLDEPTIVSLAGDDQYETAATVAGVIKEKSGEIAKAVVVPSDSYTEGVAAASLAAAKGWPVLLSPLEGPVPPATIEALDALAAASALVVGTKAELGQIPVERQMGADRYETAALIVKYALAQGLKFQHTAIVSGEDFPDGLAAAPYLSLDNGILLLAKDGELPPPMLELFNTSLELIRTLDFIALPDLAKAMASGS